MEYTLKHGNHRDLARVYPMMEFDFHGDGLIAQRYLQLAIMKGAGELLLLKDEDGLERGYAYVQTDRLYNYALIAYIAVYPTFRGQGAGTRMLELLRERFGKKQGIFIEVFGDVSGGNPKKRHELYESLGWRDVRCDYRLQGVRSRLMLLRFKGPEDVSPAAALIINSLYRDVLPDWKLRGFAAVYPEQ